MMLAIGTIALVAALVFPPDIFWLTTFIATVFASSWGPVGLMSIWSKRITESAAFWGMLSGLVFNVVPKFFEFIGMINLPSYLNPVIIGGAVSLVTTITVSRRTTVSEEEASYLTKLHETPADEISAKKTRLSLLTPALLIANGLIMPFLLIAFYVKPFQLATGTLSSDGSLDWFAGETILAMSWSVVYILLGVVAIIVIRNAYSPLSQFRPKSAENGIKG
jgi:sodium/pantothenate symporter